QRTFSWTEFFNQIEATIPPDVMLTSVRPSFKDGVTNVSMVVLGRRAADVDEFVEKLEGTGAFEDVLTANSELTDDGLQRATIHSQYVGNIPEPEAAAPASAPPGSTRPEPAISTPPARGQGAPAPAPANPATSQPQRVGGRQ